MCVNSNKTSKWILNASHFNSVSNSVCMCNSTEINLMGIKFKCSFGNMKRNKGNKRPPEYNNQAERKTVNKFLSYVVVFFFVFALAWKAVVFKIKDTMHTEMRWFTNEHLEARARNHTPEKSKKQTDTISGGVGNWANVHRMIVLLCFPPSSRMNENVHE